MYIINTYFISTHVLTFYKYSQLSKIISVSAAKNILYRLSHYANIMYKKSQNFTKQLPYIIHIYILYIDIALHKDLLKIWHIRKKKTWNCTYTTINIVTDTWDMRPLINLH